MAEEEKGTSTWYKVPTWSGNPTEWRGFKKEMNWWIASLDMDACKKYNVAARWALRQYGVVRARCEEFDPEELQGAPAEVLIDPETQESVVVTEADPFAGLRKLMKALEESVGKTELDRRGELRAQFYQELRRSPGERISAYCTRFRTLSSELKREGIDLPQAELGWFLKDRMGLDAIRKQLLETALGGREDYPTVELEALRLFRDLHVADPLRRTQTDRPPLLNRFLSQHSNSSHRTAPPSSSASQASTFRSFRSGSSAGSMRSGHQRPPFQQHRQALVAEEVDGDGMEEEELVPAQDEAGDGSGPKSLEEVLQMEAECLAAELQELEDEGSVEPGLLEDLENGVESAAESLVTMREARNRIAEVRKDRGFGKIGTGKGGSSKGGKSKMHGNQSASQKQTTICWDCGEKGHWGGDAQCTKPGAGLFKPKGKGVSNHNNPKQVKITESLNTEHSVATVEMAENEKSTHEVMACSNVALSLEDVLNQRHEASAVQPPGLSSDKRLVGALDSACNRTCSGEVWLQHYLQSLNEAPPEIQKLVQSCPESEVFRFGNGGCKTSYVRYRLPMMLGGSLLTFWVSVVDVPSLGLLLGRDFLDAIGAVLSFSRKMLRADLLDGSLVKLKQLMAGHFALPLAPPTWSTPGALRWKRLGQDGVVEIQVTSQDWLKRKLDAHAIPDARVHEHLVTEQGLRTADLSYSGLAVASSMSTASQPLAHAAQEMSRPQVATSSTTSPTRSSLGVRALLHGSSRQVLDQSNKSGRKMEQNDAARVPSRRLAHSWYALMAAATAISALCSVPIPQCEYRQPVVFAKRANGGIKGASTEACRTCTSQQDLHPRESFGTDLVPQPLGSQAGLHGGSVVGWNDGGQTAQGCSQYHEEGGRGRCKEGSGRSTEGWTSGGGSSSYGGPQRWIASSQRRPSSSCSFTSDRCLRSEADCSTTEGQVQRRDQGHQVWSKQFFSEFGNQPSEKEGRGSSRAIGKSPTAAGISRFRGVFGSFNGGTSRFAGATGAEVPEHAESGLHPHDSDAGQSISSGSKSPVLRHGSWINKVRDGPKDGRVVPRRGSKDQQRVLPGKDGRKSDVPVWAHQSDQAAVGSYWRRTVKPQEGSYEWKIHQDVKSGQAQMITDAWKRHETDRQLVSQAPQKVRAAMNADWEQSVAKGMNETFLTTIDLTTSTKNPLVQEIFTTSQRVTSEAQRRGHRVGEPLSLETGWDFRKALDRKAALKKVDKEKPYFLMIAYPCGPWSPLMRLNPAGNLEAKQAEGLELIRFALQLARLQLRGGRHFAFENPIGSGSWSLPEMIKFLEEAEARLAKFDQCRYNLRSANGGLHKKPTQVATSSAALCNALDGVRCFRDHPHDLVIGGVKVTERAGHYPRELAKALVSGMEGEFNNQFVIKGQKKKPHDALAAEDGEAEGEVVSDGSSQAEEVRSDSSDDGFAKEEKEAKIPAVVRQAVRRLHENTGHRSNKRLARALVLAGAPNEVVRAARSLKCSICDEKRAPKARRPASLPVPKDVSDQVHIDIFEMLDVMEERFYVVHCIDFASRFQMAEVLHNKSTESVTHFLKTRWFPIFGSPRVLVADQGREFISWQFEELCAQHSILLWHCAVQAPWQNGICERGGGVLKAIASAVIKSQSITGYEEMQLAMQEAVTAYNHDINDVGVSPAQAALGKQPRMQGDVLGDFGQRLAEHGLMDSKPSLARQLAMREVAKVAMTRLHFSRSLRKGFMARSRSSTVTQQLEPGMIVYYFRQSKYNPKHSNSKKKLLLKRWHGPALLVANEGTTNCFLSHKGQLTKCAREHVRPASTLEQVSAEVWRDSIEEVVEAALRDMEHSKTLSTTTTTSGPPGVVVGQEPPAPVVPAVEDISVEVPSQTISTTTQPLALTDKPRGKDLTLEEQLFTDLPPVTPQELVRGVALGSGGSAPASRLASSMPSSMFPSRRSSMASGQGGPSRLGVAMERAREAEGGEGSLKRAAEIPLEQLDVEPTSSRTSRQGPFDVLVLSHEEMKGEAKAELHPLRRLWQEAGEDRDDPLGSVVEDRGTWKGYWPLPSRSEWQAILSSGGMWPRGEQEALAVQTARREYSWREIAEKDKQAFHEAALDGWLVWVNNQAVEVLSPEQSSKVRNRLKMEGQLSRILVPRYVMTDKNDGLRTERHPLPLKANARLVVPGYKDMSAYSVRKDAPTGSRVSVHLLLTFAAAKGWNLMSADVKSAFLKGEEFEPGERELYIENVKMAARDGPRLPLEEGGLARLRKGIFGLADSPRRWYLRLHKSLTGLGFERSSVDAAMWFLWSADRTTLEAIVVSHVDDLLLGGNQRGKELLLQLGKELGFGSLEEKEFVYCGKLFKQHADGSISLSMKEYHENLKPIVIPVARRKQVESPVTPAEHRQLRALLGSLQWLVGQIRFDLGFQLCTLQGEVPTISTMLKANQLLKKFKMKPDFALWFRPMDLDGCGLLGVSDASLGNVQKDGSIGEEPMSKVYSQSAYIMLIADKDLMAGRPGRFCVLDARSHRLTRVCRSTFAAELLGVEETVDTGMFCRGCLAEPLGFPMAQRDVSASLDSVPLTVVTDAKDVFDKGNSDTPSFGSQKSLAFTVSWLRSTLRRPNTALRWTATENMLIDALTKDMDPSHLHKVLEEGKWCVKYSSAFIKQTSKPLKKNQVIPDVVEVGKPIGDDEQLASRLVKLADSPGWHREGDVVVHVARNARAFRTPKPRYDPKEYDLRSTFARFDKSDGCVEWRELENLVSYQDGSHSCTGLIGQTANVLITLFQMSSHCNKRWRPAVEDADLHG